MQPGRACPGNEQVSDDDYPPGTQERRWVLRRPTNSLPLSPLNGKHRTSVGCPKAPKYERLHGVPKSV
eukprot:scaffold281325_cov32-Tisochrysis_lutea.AAC.1